MKRIKNHANNDVRRLLKEKHLYYWQIAEQIGVAESTLLRWLRVELDAEKKRQIQSAVSELSNHIV